MTTGPPEDAAEHRRRTRDAYDRLAPVWSDATDDGPFNGGLERPALRSLVPRPIAGARILDAGCGSGGQCRWLIEHGAEVVGVDLSPGMVEEASRRCGGRGTFLVADLAGPLPLDTGTFDGITCSLVLHYLEDWAPTLASFARILKEGGWVVVSLDHPFGPTGPDPGRGYFDKHLVGDRWVKGGVEVTQYFWHRTLADTVQAFAEGGFVVERVLEPQPSPDLLARFPEELAKVDGAPWFAVYRLLRR